MQSKNTSNPREHTANVRNEFKTLINHLREDVSKMDDPAAKALFETSAEVISGLEKAFIDFERKNEEAWRGE
jgi:hypothetical protein